MVLMARPWYTTREDVKAALDLKETARSDSQIDGAIAASSDGIDGGARIGGLLNRRFYPEIDTRYFDWPNRQYARPWRLWLDQHELASVSALVVAGVTIAPGDYLLRPDSGPPYTHIEMLLSTSAAFGSSSTHQRAVAITGVYCGCPTDTEPAGALAAAISSTTATAVDVTDSSASTGVGVGHILLADSERMLVTGKRMADTGQNCSALAASNADVAITGVSPGAIAPGETILVDAERMLVVDTPGTMLIVKRAWDGTVLAAHSGGADIFAPRTLTVVRGALGTTAATHANAAAVSRHLVPDLVRELCTAKSLDRLLQRRTGYSRTTSGSGSGGANGTSGNRRAGTGAGLPDIVAEAYAVYGRKARKRAI
jgi:hypothetical protein